MVLHSQTFITLRMIPNTPQALQPPLRTTGLPKEWVGGYVYTGAISLTRTVAFATSEA
jgi:hypothetical protein